MTPQEFANAHGLSLEEAQLILEKRNRPSMDPNSRLARARAKLEAAHKKVGAAEVSVEGDEVVKGDFSSENLERFYSTKGGADSTHPQMKSDPDAWEEPP